MRLRISLGQMDVRLGQPELNQATVAGMTAEAARRGSDLVLFPELWSTGYDLTRAEQHAAHLDQGAFATMAALAREQQIHVAGSCLSLQTAGKPGNTLVLFDPDGERLGAYTKLHLFRLMDEDRHLGAGEGPVMAQTPWGPAGLAICYDLRFPELFRGYALAGAVMILVPAEWPKPRMAHWRTLLRARAIENQLFVVACNRVGRSGEDDFFGHSCIIDPWGETVIEGGEGEMLLTAELDLSRIEKARSTIPVLSDRRPDIYA
jgi:omega-amidase